MNIVCVPQQANMQSAMALHHGAVLSALDEHAVVTLDLAFIVECDLSFLQIAEVARLEATRRGKTLTLAAPVTGDGLAPLERGVIVPDLDAIFTPLASTVHSIH